MNKFISIIIAVIIGAACCFHPWNSFFLLTVLSAYGVLLWFFPRIWLFAVPAFLPLLDFSPITGLLFFNEFDLVVLSTCLIFHLRGSKGNEALQLPKVVTIIIAMLSLAYITSTIKGIFPLESLDANSFTNYYSGYISLRGIKGYIEALLLLPMLQNDLRDISNIKKYLIPGFLIGLVGVIFFGIWERHIFPGLLDFSNDYRITSSFFDMATGGAYIDAYLSMLLPLVFTCFLFWKGIVPKLIGLGLFGAGLYILLVTFSRICYASFLISMIPLSIGIMVNYKKKWKVAMFGGIIVLIVASITIPVFKGGYIRDRFEKVSQSMDVRTRHWKNAIQKMDTNWGTVLVGMGPGTYPKTYFQKLDGKKPGHYQFVSQGKNQFLRLFPGEFLYLGQRILLKKHSSDYMLTVDVISSEKKGQLSFPICEKSISYSFKCNWKTINIVNENDNWGNYKISYPEFEIGQDRLSQKKPIEFAIYNGNKDIIIDVDNIILTDSDGNNVIKNGDFTHGKDYWFFSIENHLAWHIFNVWVNLFFELGILGLLVFTAFILFVLIHQIKDILKKNMFSLILFSSFCGFFVVGLVGSLLDSPRILFLFYFISFLSICYSRHNKPITL